MVEISIISDDLTGITDCASNFYELGYECCFSIDNSYSENSDIYFFNSNTRNEKNNKVILERIREFKEKYFEDSIIIKKVDSTLRGNILIETGYLLDEFNFEKIAFLPENPQNNRIYSMGRYLVDGIPIEDSFYSKDPKSRADYKIFSKLSEKYPDKIWAPEITSQKELIDAVSIALKNKWGIMASSAVASGFPKKKEKKNEFFENGFPTVIISGSMNDRNKEQLYKAGSLFSGKHYLIDISDSENEQEYIKKAEILGEKIVNKNINVILCGGETAMLVLKGFKGFFRVVKSIDSGIPLLVYKGRKFVLKPGGFGEIDFYGACVKMTR